ncbi:serine/arginine repetitive matrix protein 1-like [Iris pallida]|nr:serine/arginine repetitive matrix protein 1-like [Iris pallida]KAJ6818898.1 serine/arginine repetitive matrix protein 1-like [Iris pallida]KAJ6835586.1 serine/arginine repetitive matrix protein 1-like [Iris pallida]KAJ6835801.1 serine/arginine repetitive matrix protein 1-like [Iris pallida]KAJ6839013.1 serine/arginine repetitive matrix protein 1-like [Iris pallida]
MQTHRSDRTLRHKPNLRKWTESETPSFLYFNYFIFRLIIIVF